MKVVTSLLFTFLVMGCGIVEMLFPIDNFPQRYIERDVNETEFIGTWKLTSESEARIITYVEEHQKDDSFWVPVSAPWKTITFYEDGTCGINFQISWNAESKVLTESDALPTCTWKIESISGYDNEFSSKYVRGLSVRFEHYDKQEDMYYVYNSDSYIVEENNELVLWDFIGDPLDLQYQDFKKTIQ